VLDPKGEYGALAAASGATPLRLGPGLGLRLNPLDVGPAVPFSGALWAAASVAVGDVALPTRSVARA
jgi:hypothetical protein